MGVEALIAGEARAAGVEALARHGPSTRRH